MATNPKTPTNPHYAAFPTLFKRTGEARRIKGFRVNREMFSRAVRMSKALEQSPRLMILTPTGAMVLSEAATTLLKQDGGVESLILNGFAIMPAVNGTIDTLVDEFIRDNKLDLKQADMFEDDEAEHHGKGSR
jgi:hypothetical protein